MRSLHLALLFPFKRESQKTFTKNVSNNIAPVKRLHLALQACVHLFLTGDNLSSRYKTMSLTLKYFNTQCQKIYVYIVTIKKLKPT